MHGLLRYSAARMSHPSHAPMNPGQLTLAVQQLHAGLTSMNGVVMRLEKKICELDAAEKLRSAHKKPVYPIEFRSQFGEDTVLWNLLGGQLDGFFIEVGAFDGYSFAVTYGLECVGWKGLLIEAIPQRAAACKEKRRHSRVVNAALGKRGATGTAEFTVVEDHWGGMLSYLTADSAHKAAIAQNQQTSTKVAVPLTSMDALLEGHTGTIDAAAIDVEGGELDLLDGFDLAKHRPRVLLLEDNGRQQESPLGRYMASKPYVQVGWVEVNRIYVRSDCQDILNRARGI